jgi:hypothetical protein
MGVENFNDMFEDIKNVVSNKSLEKIDYSKLSGKARLEYSAKKNEYYIYDGNGFICGTLGCNKEKLEEMIARSNKEVPQNAIKIKGVSSQACPICKSNVNWKYCSNCGQKISY